MFQQIVVLSWVLIANLWATCHLRTCVMVSGCYLEAKRSTVLSGLFVLINVFVLFTQLQQFLKHTQPWLCQAPCIHQFPVTFHKMHHQFFLVVVFRRITMICLNETFHLIVSNSPPFILGHNLASVLWFINCLQYPVSFYTHSQLPSRSQ